MTGPKRELHAAWPDFFDEPTTKFIIVAIDVVNEKGELLNSFANTTDATKWAIKNLEPRSFVFVPIWDEVNL